MTKVLRDKFDLNVIIMVREKMFLGFIVLARKELIHQDSIPIKAIAGYCMVSPSTVRRWIKDSKLKAQVLPSGQFRVSTTDFKEFLNRYNIRISKQLQDFLN